MATLRESYTTGADAGENIVQYSGEGSALCQKFTASGSYTVDYVRLLMLKSAGATSSFSVHVVSLTGGEPEHPGTTEFNNSRLAWGYGDTDGLTTDAAGAWYSITLDNITRISLSPGTQYAIVVTYTHPTDYIRWRQDVTSPTYSGGESKLYQYDPPQWGTYGGSVDCMFEIYGSTVFAPPGARATKKRLISAAASAIWYEDV